MLKSDYDADKDGVVDDSEATAAHAAKHENTGVDVINVTGLVGTTPRAILGDASAGRILRVSTLAIVDGTNASTIQVAVNNIWNGDTITPEDNLGKGGDVGNFALDYGGVELTIKASGLTGKAVGVLSSNVTGNSTGTVYTMTAAVFEDNILVSLFNAASGVQIDLTSVGASEVITINIAYITDE